MKMVAEGGFQKKEEVKEAATQIPYNKITIQCGCQ